MTARVIAVFLIGISLHIFLAMRSWIGGDQIHLLNLGLDFAEGGVLHPFAKLMWGAGGNPGVLMQLLVGVPLKLFPHFQSPMFVVVFFHLIGGMILHSVFRKEFGERTAFFFIVAYWMSPWRLYNGGFLWEPSFVFLPSAVHLWACWRLREQPLLFPSVVLGTILVASGQIHNSAFFLLLLTIFLLSRRVIRVRWPGLFLGAALGAITLAPTVVAVLAGDLPDARSSQGFIGESLLRVFPVFKGILYWFTLGALDVVRPLNETVFAGSGVGSIWVRTLQVCCVLSVGVAVVSSWWYFQPIWKRKGGNQTGGEWFRHYALWSFVSLVSSAALSPIVLQGWQVVIALHSATIPVILWASQKWYDNSFPKKFAVWSYLGIQILVVITLGLGHPIFRIPASAPADLTDRLMRIIPFE